MRRAKMTEGGGAVAFVENCMRCASSAHKRNLNDIEGAALANKKLKMSSFAAVVSLKHSGFCASLARFEGARDLFVRREWPPL